MAHAFQKRERRKFTVEEYLHLEEADELRHELVDGEIFAMTGGSLNHNRIGGNLFSLLSERCSDKCEAFINDVRLHVQKHGLITYPDVLLVCGSLKSLPGHPDTLIDATLVAEVLSPSTERYDRSDKAGFYRALPGLTEQLLIAQERVYIEHYTRQGPNQWQFSEFTSLEDVLVLPSIELQISLKDLYARVDWE